MEYCKAPIWPYFHYTISPRKYTPLSKRLPPLFNLLRVNILYCAYSEHALVFGLAPLPIVCAHTRILYSLVHWPPPRLLLSPVTADDESCFDASWLVSTQTPPDFLYYTFIEAAVHPESHGSCCDYEKRREGRIHETKLIFEQMPPPHFWLKVDLPSFFVLRFAFSSVYHTRKQAWSQMGPETWIGKKVP